MEKLTGTMGTGEGTTELIPVSNFGPSAIPTSYATFSTGCSETERRDALHLGFIIEFSTYQQA